MRNLITIALVLIVAALLYFNIFNRDRFTEQIQELHNINDSLKSQIASRDAKLIEHENYISAKQDSLQKTQEQLIIKQAELRQLEAALDTLPNKVIDIPPDEVYNVLQEIYPTKKEPEYPFAEDQVQDIYLTFLQKRQKELINNNLRYQIGDYQKQVSLLKDVTDKQQQTISLMKKTRIDQDEIIINQDAVIDYQRSEIVRERRRKFFWMGVAGLAIGSAIYF